MPAGSAIQEAEAGGCLSPGVGGQSEQLCEILIKKKKKKKGVCGGQALVAHACNPSYSGGSDQQDHGLKPARASSS
jgi:hypothetical protein